MKNRIVFCIVMFFIFFSVLWARGSNTSEKPSLPALTPRDGKIAINTSYKNVQRLTYLNEPELERVMSFITESIGVQCTFCHKPENYSLDDNLPKKRDREMIGMVQYINRDFFKAERISCYTCHAGSPSPGYLPEGFNALPSLINTGKPRQLPDSYRNVHKLTHLTPQQYDEVMNFFVAAVGAVTCSTCHNIQNFSSDENPQKVRAREMIGMVQKINPKFFQGERLTCYTCHQGKPFPKQLPENWTPG